ncbi:hypothetical protein ACNTMW_20890 [Planosporangium sp. 12N6]|uniref:hypothetical protein n=1 Tax=Planosporangium spinosum TaxID=3402278 RepID=UPI003CEB7E95
MAGQRRTTPYRTRPRGRTVRRRGRVWKVALFASLLTLIVLGGRMAFAAQDDQAAGITCTLVVPADPLSAAGLATPYELMGPCHEADPDTAAFVQGTIIDPATGQVSVYDPLVVDRGKRPAVAPARPSLPAGAVVGLWFGFNGDNLVLRGTSDSLAAGRCVNGLGASAFGQFAYCNAGAFFAAASSAVAAGRLTIPHPGTARNGLPCPTVRDFGLVDMDQSDNVTSTYLFLADGSTAQNTAANRAALAARGAKIVINGSDNALLDDFVDPALGCTPYTAPDLAQPGRTTTALALNELQAAAFQAEPVALVPISDPMATVDGRTSVAKANLYRAGVGQRPVDSAVDRPEAYCRNVATAGPARVQADRALTRRASSPNPGVASDLFAFLAQRLAGTFDELGCGKLLKVPNPVTVVTDKKGVAVDARFAAAVPPVPAPSGTPSATRSTAGASPTQATPRPTATAQPTRSTPGHPTATAQPTGSTPGHPTATAQPTRSTPGHPTPAATPTRTAAGHPAAGAAPSRTTPAAPGTVPTAGADRSTAGDQMQVADQVAAASTTDQQPAVADGGVSVQPASAFGDVPTAPAPVRHAGTGGHTLPVTGPAVGTALAVGGALLMIGLGLRRVRRGSRVGGWRVVEP